MTGEAVTAGVMDLWIRPSAAERLVSTIVSLRENDRKCQRFREARLLKMLDSERFACLRRGHELCSSGRDCAQMSPMKSRSEHGFALIDLVFVCGLIGILASIAMPRMLQARQSAGAASAIGSLRAVNSAQLSYAFTCGSGFYAPSLTVLGTAPPGGNEAFISPGLGSADSVSHSGYLLQLEGTAFAGAPPSCNGLGVGESAQGFKAAADALEPTNPRNFATNANITIIEDVASLWATMPESGEAPSGHPLQ